MRTASTIPSTKFLSTPSARRATLPCRFWIQCSTFLSTPSARRATFPNIPLFRQLHISTHALREEGDHFTGQVIAVQQNFYPRPPRGGRHCPDLRSGVIYCISTHALREEGDADTFCGGMNGIIFLPTPSARRATLCLLFLFVLFVFLPTPSARRATSALWAMTSSHRYFYPRPPRGGRPGTAGRWPHRQRISTHALREEGDQFGPGSFNYTINISTHALREEGDQTVGGLIYDQHNFYPRPPRGGRRFLEVAGQVQRIFLPTPSARRATWVSKSRSRVCHLFLPTPSARRATGKRAQIPRYYEISTHALREEGDPALVVVVFVPPVFLPTPSARRATAFCLCASAVRSDFYPRPPRGGRPGT